MSLQYPVSINLHPKFAADLKGSSGLPGLEFQITGLPVKTAERLSPGVLRDLSDA